MPYHTRYQGLGRGADGGVGNLIGGRWAYRSEPTKALLYNAFSMRLRTNIRIDSEIENYLHYGVLETPKLW